MSINDRLREAREAKNLSMKALSDLINTPERSIGNYERGERKPSYEYIQKLTTQLGINANWILTGQGGMFIEDCSKQNINGSNNVQLNNASIHISHNQKEIEEIVNILKDLPERSIKKLYHLAELEKLENK